MQIYKKLSEIYSYKTILKFNNNWQCLVAIMLSAQCRDVMVNKVTDTLFKKRPDVKDYLSNGFENEISSLNLYKTKAKNILSCANILIDKYGGVVPSSMDDLINLPGVGRKTANAVLFHCYNKSVGIVVDTHVTRVSNRLGLSTNHNAEKIEKDLCKIFPENMWGRISNLMIGLGRDKCSPKNPKCDTCSINKYCDYFNSTEKKVNKQPGVFIR